MQRKGVQPTRCVCMCVCDILAFLGFSFLHGFLRRLIGVRFCVWGDDIEEVKGQLVEQVFTSSGFADKACKGVNSRCWS